MNRRRSIALIAVGMIAVAVVGVVLLAGGGGSGMLPSRDSRVPRQTGVAINVGNERPEPVIVRLDGMAVARLPPGATFDGATFAGVTPRQAVVEIVDSRTGAVVFKQLAVRGQLAETVAITPVGAAPLRRPDDPNNEDPR